MLAGVLEKKINVTKKQEIQVKLKRRKIVNIILSFIVKIFQFLDSFFLFKSHFLGSDL